MEQCQINVDHLPQHEAFFCVHHSKFEPYLTWVEQDRTQIPISSLKSNLMPNASCKLLNGASLPKIESSLIGPVGYMVAIFIFDPFLVPLMKVVSARTRHQRKPNWVPNFKEIAVNRRVALICQRFQSTWIHLVLLPQTIVSKKINDSLLVTECISPFSDGILWV